MIRRCGICLSLLVVLAAGPAAAALEPAADGAGSVPPMQVGLLVFIDGRPQTEVPVPIAELRRFTTSRFEYALADHGLAAAPQAALDSLRIAWRIRTDLTIGEDFLRDCHEVHGLTNLLVANLISQHEHLLLTVRNISCPDGRLVSVAIEDADLQSADSPHRPDGSGLPQELVWQNRLQALIARTVAAVLGSAPDPARSGEPTEDSELMLMLPVAGVATGAVANTAATHIFLQQLLATNRWQVIDPGLVVGTLRADGQQPAWLGAEARRLLIRRFGAGQVILPELISYDASRTRTVVLVIEDDLPERPHTIQDFAIAVRMVDLRQGAIVATSHLFVNSSQRIGWFGQPLRGSLLQKLSASAHELWLTFLADLNANERGGNLK